MLMAIIIHIYVIFTIKVTINLKLHEMAKTKCALDNYEHPKVISKRLIIGVNIVIINMTRKYNSSKLTNLFFTIMFIITTGNNFKTEVFAAFVRKQWVVIVEIANYTLLWKPNCGEATFKTLPQHTSTLPDVARHASFWMAFVLTYTMMRCRAAGLINVLQFLEHTV